MSKTSKKDVEIIVKYKNNVNEKTDKTLQELMQKLFNSYIMKAIQNIRKGKWLFFKYTSLKGECKNVSSGK